MRHPAQYERLSSAVVEKAPMHDIVYPACVRCNASLTAAFAKSTSSADALVLCASCGHCVARMDIAYKYRVRLQLATDSGLMDAMVFDDAAEQQLFGVPAGRVRKLQLQHPTLTAVMEDLLVGLRVSVLYQRGDARLNAATFAQKDIKIVAIQPLAAVLMPRKLVSLAMAVITQQQVTTLPRSGDNEGER